jgi:uncharacterized protein (DUF1800 family)
VNSKFHEIDPRWAWRRYEPGGESPWNKRRAAHLFRRAGFGADTALLNEAISSSPEELIEQLVVGVDSSAFTGQMNQMMRTLAAGNNPRNLASGWLYRMRYTPNPLHEKMALFWHGHFATSGAKVEQPELLLNQNELFRRHALGNFGQLVLAIARDPAMLLYLDSATNRKSHPNENFARELLELFCLGLGAYSERDIQELARCFTGWEVNQGKFRFNHYQADTGVKSIFAEHGGFTGDDGVRVVLEQPATSRFIVRKLLRFFVADGDFPEALVEPLAAQFRADGLQLAGVMRTILGSELFFSEQVAGQKVRSPVEFGIGLLCGLDATANLNMLAEELGALGQSLYFPPNVKGWDGGKSWINSATILGRGNLARRLLTNSETRFGGRKLPEYLAGQGVVEAEAGLNRLLELFVAIPIPDSSHARLLELARRGDAWADVLHAITVLPEFQLS